MAVWVIMGLITLIKMLVHQVDSVTTPHIDDPVGFVRAVQTAKEHAAGR